eukprot:398459_1
MSVITNAFLKIFMYIIITITLFVWIFYFYHLHSSHIAVTVQDVIEPRTVYTKSPTNKPTDTASNVESPSISLLNDNIDHPNDETLSDHDL